METVEGGGLIVFLLDNMSSLKQLYTKVMVSIFFLKSKSIVDLQLRMCILTFEQKVTKKYNQDLMKDSSFL